jgi:hypothetical protein
MDLRRGRAQAFDKDALQHVKMQIEKTGWQQTPPNGLCSIRMNQMSRSFIPTPRKIRLPILTCGCQQDVNNSSWRDASEVIEGVDAAGVMVGPFQPQGVVADQLRIYDFDRFRVVPR